MHCPPCLGQPQGEASECRWEGAAGGPRARWARGGGEQGGGRLARMGRGDHGGRGGEGRPGHGGGSSGPDAEALLDLRSDELLDTQETTLDLDAFF